MACDVFQLKKDREDQDKWVIVDDGVPLGLVFENEDFAKACATHIDFVGYIQTGIGTFRKLLVFMKDKKIEGDEGKSCVIRVIDVDRKGGFVDNELTQVAELVNRGIDREIGFDRYKDCPKKESQNGVCETCPYLRQEEILDDEYAVVGHRWMCSLRRNEVIVAEKLSGEISGQ